MTFQLTCDPAKLKEPELRIGVRLAREAGLTDQQIMETFRRDPPPPPPQPTSDWLFIGTIKPRPSFHADRILKLCAEFAGVTVDELKSPRREQKLTRARQVAAYMILRHCTNYSMPMVGKKLHRDHTTILHAKRRVEADLLDGGRLFIPIIGYVQDRIGSACVDRVDKFEAIERSA